MTWFFGVCLLSIVLVNRAEAQSISPASLFFGTQAVGTTSATKIVTFTNNKKVAITIAGLAIDLTDYSQTNNCPLTPATLAPGANCIVSVTFMPTLTGARPGQLIFTDSATQKVVLNGTGIVAVATSPSSLPYGSVVVGRKSGLKTITVKNNQTTDLTISSISTNLTDYSISIDTCPISPLTLPGRGSCKISLIFSPTTLGLRNGTLMITDDASNSPSIPLTGTGVPAAAVAPASLIFASQPLGTTSAPQVVTLVNNQSSALTISSITSSLADFTLQSTCTSKLAAGASCSVAVTFSPAAIGIRSGTLAFVDNANDSPQTVTVTGTGAPAALISITVTPGNPSISVGSTQQFTATGSYTNGTQQDLTSTATWSSSTTSVATISTAGMATAAGAGNATISASTGTITGNTTLTVTAPILSRVPERICSLESESASSVSCALTASVPAGSGLALFITSTTAQILGTGAVQDSESNTYTILGDPVSGGYATIYSAYSQLTNSLQPGDAITINVPASDSWGVAVYDIGPVQSARADVGTTFQNPNVGPSDMINPATGVAGWWTGQTAKTSGTSDLCMASVGVGSANYPGGGSDGAPPAIPLFAADNSFHELDIRQTYAQSDPNFTNGGAILTIYSEVPSGSAVQSDVVNYGSMTNTAPAALYCFQEGPGMVSKVPWFTGNYCTGTVSCTINNVTAGDMLIIGSHSYVTLPPTPMIVTDNQPETINFDQLDGSVGLGSWHVSPVINSGSHTITVNDSVDPSLGMVVVEIAGQASGNPIEAVAQNSILENTAPTVSITTQTPNDLIFGWGRSYYGSDEGEGFTAIRVMPTAEYAAAPAAGPQTVTLLPRGTPPWSDTGIEATAIRPAGSSAPQVLSPTFTGNYCIASYPNNACTLINVAAGDILVISSLEGGTLSQPPSVTDTLGELFVTDRGNDSDGAITLSTWHIAPVMTAGTHTITVDGAVAVVVSEYTAQSPTSPIDAITVASQTTGGFASSTVQTSQGNDLIYAWCATDSPSGWGDGFAAFLTSPTSEYRMAASTPGLETATCPSVPDNPASGWVIQELAIRH